MADLEFNRSNNVHAPLRAEILFKFLCVISVIIVIKYGDVVGDLAKKT